MKLNEACISLGCGRRGSLAVSELVFESSAPGSSPGQGHCVVFLGKTLYSHSASHHLLANFMLPPFSEFHVAVVRFAEFQSIV